MGEGRGARIRDLGCKMRVGGRGLIIECMCEPYLNFSMQVRILFAQDIILMLQARSCSGLLLRLGQPLIKLGKLAHS